jgi:hypothetical protein
MSNIFAKIIPSEIDKDKARDTGMAMVLIFLILELIYHNNIYYKIAMVALVIDMIAPLFFKPLGYVWFGLAHMIGTVVSSILLFLIYMLIVFPVALIRRILGKDSLKLKDWKTGTESVLRERNYLFKADDIEKPY